METAGAVVLSGISYYCNVEENKNKLIETIERLNTRKLDVLSRMNSELRSGKKLKMETQLWLDNVEKKKEEARDLENKVAEGVMERVSLGRSLSMKMEEAERLYEMGSFADGLVLDETPCEDIGVAGLSEKTRRTKKKKKKTIVKNNGGKISIIGQGGIGKTRIKNTGGTNFKFGNIQI